MFRRNCELGKNISIMRRRAGINQQQLAEQLTELTGVAISNSTISNWERGIVDIPAAVMPDICHVLHCTSYELYPHSETLTDRDVQLIQSIKAMGADEKADLYYLLHEWQGDRKALLKLDVIHAVQSRDMRYAADKLIIESYMDAARDGYRGIDRRASISLDYVKRAHKKLLDDD